MNSHNVKSQVAYMILEKGNFKEYHLQIKEEKDAIRILIKNKHIPKSNLSLGVPGKSKYWKFELKKKSAAVIVGFDFPGKIEETMKFIVHMRFRKPPTKDLYDVRLNITWNALNDNVQTNDLKQIYPIGSLGNATPNALCRIIDHKSFICHQFNESASGSVWFSAKYFGPMPPKKITSNKYTYSVDEHTNYWNFTSTISEASCMFWNESMDSFDQTGVKVIY